MENAAAGLVGPLESSSFNLPSVDKALTEMEAGVSGGGTTGANLGASVSGTSAADRRLSRGARAPVSTLSTSGATAGNTGIAAPTSLTSNSPGAGALGQTQQEVLKRFFDSLLSSKDRVGATTTATMPSPPRANGAGAAEE